jgi:hypothetical protein
MYLKNNTVAFCACADGQRRKKAWGQGCEMAKVEFEAKRVRRRRRVKQHDFKAGAAGERIPGDDEEVPF